VFGKYQNGGEAELEMTARLTGEDKVYRTRFEFPEVDTDNPEIERLWALNQIERIEDRRSAGALPDREAGDMIRELGLGYQLVTDETSMVVLSDASFEQHGIERRNQRRTGREHVAQSARAQQAPTSYVVDRGSPFTGGSAPTHRPRGSGGGGGGGGGGSLSPLTALGMLAMALAAAFSLRGDRQRVE